MCFRFLSVWVCIALPVFAPDPRPLRVCADPDNLPFSNRAGQGFENALAQLIASRVGEAVEYVWRSQKKSFEPNALTSGLCDVFMGVPSSLDSVAVTRPYYRSSYVFVSRRDRNLHIASLLDSRLSQWRIGLQVVGEDYAPPAVALARQGITQNIVGFSLFGAGEETNASEKIIDAVEHGDVDVAIVWGPVAGYYGLSAKLPLAIEPVSPSVFSGIPFAFAISMGVRGGNSALKAKLDDVIRTDGTAIGQLLARFGVPQVR